VEKKGEMKMKKTLVILLALIMVVSLAACTNANKTEEPTKEKKPIVAAEPDASSDTVGYMTDNVDHNARDPYNFVYMYYDDSPLVESTFASFENLGSVYNFNITKMSGDESPETYMTNLQALIDRGDVDGFFIDTDPQFQDQLMSVLDASKIPYMNMYTAFFDEQGASLTVGVGLDQYKSGFESMQWLIDHYKEFWGDDVDTSTIGLLDIDFSISPDLQARTKGIEDSFSQAFPDNKNIFIVDGLTGGTVSTEVGFDLTSQTVTANSKVKYWLVSSCLENYAQGAARAAEELGRDDQFLISDVGSTILPTEWDTGYDGAWKTCYAMSDYAYSAPAALGLIAIADERATADTLWQEIRDPKDKRTIWEAESGIITKGDYKQFFEEADAKYGVG
jgi:ABC-type sugar transport system substrate-binding protein